MSRPVSSGKSSFVSQIRNAIAKRLSKDLNAKPMPLADLLSGFLVRDCTRVSKYCIKVIAVSR